MLQKAKNIDIKGVRACNSSDRLTHSVVSVFISCCFNNKLIIQYEEYIIRIADYLEEVGRQKVSSVRARLAYGCVSLCKERNYVPYTNYRIQTVDFANIK